MKPNTQETVHVACVADDGYVMALAAMIKSTLTSLAVDRMLSVHILDAGIDEADKDRLIRSWGPENPEVRWYRPDPSLLGGLPLWGRMRVPTYYRLQLPNILPAEMGRVIWLDCDMIVEADLARLWDLDQAGRAVLAVQDMVVPHVSSRYGLARYGELGLEPTAKYFNAGLMLIDLWVWRRLDVAERVIAYLADCAAQTFFWDQDGLNAVLAGQWGELDPRWNQIASVTGRSFFRPAHLEPQVYRRVVDDPWIVHHAGFWKPWIFENESSMRKRFFQVLDTTDWAGWRPKRSVGARVLGFYESTLRNFFYPLEAVYMKVMRRLTLQRVERRGR